MTHISDASNKDTLKVAAPLATDPNVKGDRAKKSTAVLLSTLSEFVESAEKSSAHKIHHSHSHNVDVTEEELDSSVNTDSSADESKDLGDSNSGSDDSDDCSDSDAPPAGKTEKMDPLMALVMAGIEVQSSVNTMITSLSTMSTEITDATTSAETASAKYVQDFYNYGTISNSLHIDQNKAGAGRNVYFKIVDGRMMMSGDNKTSWNDIGKAVKNSDGKYEMPTSAQMGDSAYKFSDNNRKNWDNDSSALGSGGVVDMQMVGPANSWFGGGGIANASSTDQPVLIQLWQSIQSQASETNNEFQTVAAIPGTMLQGLTESVNTAQSGQSSFIQSEQSIASTVSGWAGV